MKKTNLSKRIVSLFLCISMLTSYIPFAAKSASPVSLVQSAITETVADPGTAYTWENMMGTDTDGNRYAGRVWVDKSVYKNGDTAVLNTRGEDSSSFKVSLEDDEAFQIVFSALGSTMTTKSSTTSTGPVDVVLVLDTSTSMDDEDASGVTRLERTIKAANGLLDDLLTIRGVRIAIVTYNKDSETVLPLASYGNGIDLVVTDYYNNNSSDAGVVTAYDNDRNVLGKDSGYTQGTNLQSGIDRGFNILANAEDVEGRVPVAIVLTDGQANRASQEGFYELSSHSDKDGTGASGRNLYLSTLLNAAYTKTKIEANYGEDATVYTVGVDITSNVVARLLMNPADSKNGFNSSNSDYEVRKAYENFTKWAGGQTVTHNSWTFNHSYPTQSGVITDAKIAANINYADTYYDVSNSDLSITFKQIYEEISSGAFNPISSSTNTQGATGVDDTPLIYVDFIGEHMEIKEIQSVTLFGSSHDVIQKADGTYVVDSFSGINPTTGENWNTAEDILINVIPQADGTQKLEIRINQEILPIIMEQIVSETIGDETTATITEIMQEPLRVYYTVGVASDVLLPNGEIDVSKIQGYSDIDNANGTVSFYSNRFGVKNAPDANGDVYLGDAHVGFLPSPENRYYYHQSNQGIFTKITDKSTGKTVTIPENNEFGIVWDDSKYELTWMTYDAYKNMKDTDRVYTYVSYYHPTPDATDTANAAEAVTYLIYADWKYMKESITFYDAVAKAYLNGGKAVEAGQADAVVTAYKQSNPTAEIYAVLGIGSHRSSRLHNMTVQKVSNDTQTAIDRYAPEYTYETAADHNGNDVVVWLGNNGKLTVKIDTGIALTKAVTKPIGNADDTYELTVTVPAGVVASPVAVDANGETVRSSYSGNVFTVYVKADQTVYVSGIPGGTECEIGEVIGGDYYVANKTDRVTVPLVSQALSGGAQFVPATVTNAPNEYGNLFITKEIESDHAIPEAVLATPFEITVNLGIANTTFKVVDSEHASPYDKTTDAAGNIVFQIKARQTVEILDLPQGTRATVVENLTPAQQAIFTDITYRARNHSGDTAVENHTGADVTVPASANATTVIINTYEPQKTAVDLDIAITKSFGDASVASRLPGGDFKFLVEEYNPDTKEWSKLTDASVSYLATEYGERYVTIEDVLKNKEFLKVGATSYRIVEEKGSATAITYDRTVYTFDVIVTDENGQLQAKVIGNNNTEITNNSGDGALDYAVTFTNTFETAPISMDIEKTVKNLSGDSAVTAQGFKFRSIATDANGIPLDPSEPITPANLIVSDAAGKARISGFFTKEQIRTHHYLVYEVNENLPGWTYSGAQYLITVVVEEIAGKLQATMTIEPHNDAARSEKAPTVTDQNKGKLYFTNTYDPEDVTVDLNGKVFKELEGMPLQPNQFSFTVYKDGDRTTPILTGTNDYNGNVNFVYWGDVLTLSGVGTTAYDVVEDVPAGAVYDANTDKFVLNGMSYDPTVFDLVVEVTNDPVTGKLVASYYFEDSVSNVVTFRNSYKASATQYALGGIKVLHGRSLRADEFSFDLYEGGTWIETVQNKADGSFRFSPISYTEPGTYTYTIHEKDGNVPGVRYDGVNTPVTVTVTVTDVAGQLQATANLANADVKFENTYTAKNAQITFNGTKILKGDASLANLFSFKLYKTDNSFEIVSGTEEQTVQNQSGTFSFTRSFSETGTFFFAIAEDTSNPVENVVYDRTQHNFIVQISDVGDGQLKAKITNAVTGSVTASAASVSANVSFTNASFDEVTEKEVYLAGNTSTEIDGKKVNAGDILTYFITYTNYTGANVVVDIMDTIPNHTSYVPDSASHGGTYAGTHVNWILNVAKGESVTVSFDVKVDETEAIVANTAVVRDGVNTYTTNEVVNHTVDGALDKDVFSPEDTSVSIDGKKVYEGDELIYTILFTNASGNEANVTVTDVIPANTTYVDGSATDGGVYDSGSIVWKLENIPAWETVAVSFKVTVNSGIGAVTIKNRATATDGSNSFETEWVSNYTVVDEVEKKVLSAADPKISIDGKKVYEGEELVYSITYKNTAKESATVTITDSIPQYTTYVEGSASEGGVYDSGVITWTKTVEANGSVTVTFKVKVNDDIADKTISNKATIVDGKNTYTTDAVTNYTVYDEVEKDVFLETAPTVSIDGEKVYAGDVLLYTVTYENTAKEVAEVTITDAIPQYTAYVEGSASEGGVYDNGVITWTKTVKANESVTVSFKVKVEDAGNVTVSNKAEIREGRNTYTTNVVTNYTVDDEVKKDVFSQEAPTVSIDGKKVYAGDTLIYKIDYENRDAKKVTVTITDVIPQYTEYVDGSATNGGVYNGGEIVWTLDVEAGETATVSFKVKVQDAGNVTVSNDAEIKEGRNTYRTNKVTNYTVDDEVEKDVFFETEPTVSIDGKKVYAGDTLVYAIRYTNSAAEIATVTITDRIPEHTAYVEGSATSGGTYDSGVITWNLNVDPGNTVTVFFKVAVKDNAKNAQLRNKANVLEGKNTYETNEVFNYTTEDEVEKKVFDAKAPTVSIDGKPVKNGDTLIYTIRYKNTSSEKASVTVTDTVPEYTEFVVGSASHGGVYQDGVITWNLEVEADAEVTVSFQVKVAHNSKATIKNKAVIVEGRNTYTTNEVTTTITIPEVPKDPTSPVTGDSFQLGLWYALLFISGTTLFSVSLYERKRKKAE